MRVTLAEQFKEAFAKVGKEIPTVSRPESAPKSHPKSRRNNSKSEKRQTKSPSASSTASPAPTKTPAKAPPTSKASVQGKTKKKPRAPKSKEVIPRRKATPTAFQPLDYDVYRRGVCGSKGPPTPLMPATSSLGSYSMSLQPFSSPVWDNGLDTEASPLLTFELTGQDVQCWPQRRPLPTAERDLVLGLDFGTSTVKAVFGDSSLGNDGLSFAVPFCKDQGLVSYLLPCRLYQEGDLFSLKRGSQVYSDLKLELLTNSALIECQQRVVAFFALVIRQARAWLFTQHASVYQSSKIIWRLSVGLPSESHFSSWEAPLFELLGSAAWILAGSQSTTIDTPNVATALSRARQLQGGATPDSHEDVEVSVVPEIAAQIYGYVASEHFDRDAPNDFMMVDVGAGTVDVSLFHVKPGRGGKWDFEFYTTVVKPYGVINLHRHRLEWWEGAIQRSYSELGGLITAIEDGKKVSDIQTGLPPRLEDYFTDSQVTFMNPDHHVDTTFFKKVFSQVFHDGYWKASTGHLTRDELNNIPIYLCGGGSRHTLYQTLKGANGHHSFYSWMKVDFRILNKPSNLDAPGLRREEFDRLSVAYGLSFLDVGKVVKAVPHQRPRSLISDTWRDNYMDK